MAIRLSGMNSGLDTDAIVKELVSAYNLKTEKYEKSKTKLEWKQDAWKSLNTKIYGLYTNISNLRYSSAYNMKKTTVSDITKAKVTASSNAVIGTQTLSVNKMAQSTYLTGAKLKLDKDEEGKERKVTKDTTLADLGYNYDGTSEIQIKDREGNAITWEVTKKEGGISNTEEVNSITIDKNTTISEFVSYLKEAGLNANFDQNNQRFFISAKESGTSADFSLSDGGNGVLGVLGLDTTINYDREQALYNNYYPTTGTDVEGYINTLQKKYQNISDPTEQEKFRNQYADIFDDNGGPKCDEDIETLVGEILSAKEKLENRAVKINGSDAEIVLNGATYTSSTNSFSINGLTIEAMGVTDTNSPLSITTATDTQGLYDKIKDFLTEYNNIINELTKLYNADSAGSYEPLTDEEKDAMSESEIEKWETKIKDSLLRRDSSVNSIMSVMINVMSQSIVVGGTPVIGDDKVEKDSYGNVVYQENTGTKLTLSHFGIQTLGFLNAAKNEQNAYHIDGDEDDVNTSGKTDKLMKAIQENPDQICEFMQSLTTKLYSVIDNKMKSTTLSSAYKVYNDKEMDSQLKNYKELISKWEEKVSQKEEYYYKKFTAMETALSKIQNQTNSLSGLFGM